VSRWQGQTGTRVLGASIPSQSATNTARRRCRTERASQ